MTKHKTLLFLSQLLLFCRLNAEGWEALPQDQTQKSTSHPNKYRFDLFQFSDSKLKDWRTLFAKNDNQLNEPLSDYLGDFSDIGNIPLPPPLNEYAELPILETPSSAAPYCLTLSEVVKETIQYQWSIQSSELNIVTQQGLLLQAKGAFNPMINAAWARTLEYDLQNALAQQTGKFGKLSNANLSVTTLTRIGTTYEVGFTNENTFNPLLPPRSDNSTLNFTITQPLLRNFLYSPQTTLEETQILQLKASRLQNVQNIAQSIFNSLFAYWEFVAAKKLLVVQERIERELCDLEIYAEDLVREEQEGYASLYQPRADLALAIANRVQAEQNVRSTFNTLLFNMGRLPNDDEEIPNVEAENFPVPKEICPVEATWYDTLLQQIPDLRADVVAFGLLEEVAELNLRSAKNSLLPQLNVIGTAEVLNTKIQKNSHNEFSSVQWRNPQKEYTIGVSFSYPLFNDTARGLVRQQRAAREQAIVNTQLLLAQIISAYKSSFTLYNALLVEVAKARRSAKQYRLSVEAETIKLQAGLSDYFFVLQLETNWQNAETQLILTEKLLAENLLQLRLLTGTLVKWNASTDDAEVLDVLSLAPIFPNPPCTTKTREKFLKCESLTQEEMEND